MVRISGVPSMPRHVPDAHHFCFAIRIDAQILRHAHLRYSAYALKTVLAPFLSLLATSVSRPRSTFTPKATAMKHGRPNARFFERWAWHRS